MAEQIAIQIEFSVREIKTITVLVDKEKGEKIKRYRDDCGNSTDEDQEVYLKFYDEMETKLDKDYWLIGSQELDISIKD